MKLSESENYLDYLDARALEDWARAKSSIQACLDTPSLAVDQVKSAYLLQLLAEILFEEGQLKPSLDTYRLAEMADPSSLLVKYHFARFLAEKVGDSEAAVRKCDEIEVLARQTPHEESSEDFSSEEYARRAKGLKQSIAAIK